MRIGKILQVLRIGKILQVLGVVFILIILGLISIVLISSVYFRRAAEIYAPYQESFSPQSLHYQYQSPSFLEDLSYLGESVKREFTSSGGNEVKKVASEAPNRLVIKTGELNMVVKDIKKSVENITKYTQEKGGWVVVSNITEREQVPSGSITIRIPAEIFDEAMAYFRSLAEKVTHESVQGQDVTEEYIDLQSRLRNLEATENQLLKIMERAGTITEVLDVQRQLTNVREQIERTKGRIQYLEQSVKMSTITINLALSEESLPIPPAEKWRPVYVFKIAWRSVLGTLRTISYLLIWIAVYSIIWIPLVVLIWLVRKFWKKRKELKV